MGKVRKNHDAAFKARIALEAIKGEKTIAQLASECGVYPNQIGQWKKRLLRELPGVFSGKRKKEEKDRSELEDELYRQIGQLKVELDWLKKNLTCLDKEKRELIDREHSAIPIYRQCELVGISRSGYYYKGTGEDPLNLHLMRLIDEQYTRTPFYGVEKITECLKKKGYPVNRKRIRRLMRKMGLEAVYPGPRDRKSTRLNSSHTDISRMPSSA